METTNELCRILTQKREVFMRYENETAALLTCPIEEIEQHMNARQQLAGEVDGLDAHIAQLTQKNKDQQKELECAIKNQCARHELSPNVKPVFDASQQIFAIIHRIQRMETNVEERVKYEQKMLLEKIKQLNRSSTAKASKYYGKTGIAETNNFSPFHSKKA